MAYSHLYTFLHISMCRSCMQYTHIYRWHLGLLWWKRQNSCHPPFWSPVSTVKQKNMKFGLWTWTFSLLMSKHTRSALKLMLTLHCTPVPDMTSLLCSQMKRITTVRWSDTCHSLLLPLRGQCSCLFTDTVFTRVCSAHDFRLQLHKHTNTKIKCKTHAVTALLSTFAESSYLSTAWVNVMVAFHVALIQALCSGVWERAQTPTLSTAVWLPIPTPPIPHLQGHAAVQRGSQGLSAGAGLCLAVGRRVSVPAFPKPLSQKPPATAPAAAPQSPSTPLTCPNAQW